MASKIANMFAASRFVLPEQRELYLQIKEDEKLVSMPTIEQDELESFHYALRDAGREILLSRLPGGNTRKTTLEPPA